MMNLNWIKCTEDKWCNFINVNLSHDHFDNLVGVYVIWHEGQGPNVVRVGQGIIKNRIAEHRDEPEITTYGSQGNLLCTWAAVAPQYLDGIEAYLGVALSPKVGSRFPDVPHIQVNHPGQE